MRPNFLVIGAEKSGTTWLYECLKKHPEIYLPDTKEIHYFNRLRSDHSVRDRFLEHDISWYERFFEGADEYKCIGEVTPMYLCDAVAMQRIHETLGQIKLIVMLRDPVDRAISHYKMARAKGKVKEDFQEISRKKDDIFIGRGMYGKQLEKVYGLFAKENVHIILFDEVVSRPFEVMDEVFEFLGVGAIALPEKSVDKKVNDKSGFRSPVIGKLINRITVSMRSSYAGGRLVDLVKKIRLAGMIKKMNAKKPETINVLNETVKELKQYYSEDIEKTAMITGKNLDAWK